MKRYLSVLLIGSALCDAEQSPKTASGRVAGLMGMYFNLPTQARNVPMIPDPNPAHVRVDPHIDFNWSKQPPVPRVGSNHFAVRWVGYLKVDKPGVYTFRVTHDSGLRFKVDKEVLYDRMRGRAENQRIDVKLEERGWLAFEAQYHSVRARRPVVRIEWARPGETNFSIIPPEHFAHDTAVGVMVRERKGK